MIKIAVLESSEVFLIPHIEVLDTTGMWPWERNDDLQYAGTGTCKQAYFGCPRFLVCHLQGRSAPCLSGVEVSVSSKSTQISFARPLPPNTRGNLLRIRAEKAAKEPPGA
jgi:hypothetical protein